MFFFYSSQRIFISGTRHDPYGDSDHISGRIQRRGVTATDDQVLNFVVNRTEIQVSLQRFGGNESGGDQIRFTFHQGGDHVSIVFHDLKLQIHLQVFGERCGQIVLETFLAVGPLVVAGTVVARDHPQGPPRPDHLQIISELKRIAGAKQQEQRQDDQARPNPTAFEGVPPP